MTASAKSLRSGPRCCLLLTDPSHDQGTLLLGCPCRRTPHSAYDRPLERPQAFRQAVWVRLLWRVDRALFEHALHVDGYVPQDCAIQTDRHGFVSRPSGLYDGSAGTRSGADQPVRYELNGRLAVGVHGEVRMERDNGPRPIRSVRYGSKVVRVRLDEHVAVLDGPDVLRIAIPKVRRVGRTGPVDGNRYSLAVHDLVEVQRPCLLEEREVHDPVAVGGYGVELASAEERLGEALRERKDVRTRNRGLRPSSPGSSQRQTS